MTASILLGAAFPLSFAPFGLWWLCPLILAGLLLAWELAEPRIAVWLGAGFGFAAFTAGTYWLYISMHDFGGVPPPLAVSLMVLLFMLMAAWLASCAWLVTRFSDPGSPTRYLLAFPFAWVLVEWMRGWALSGFPWLSAGYGQIDGPLAGWAPLGGVYLVSWIAALTAGLVAGLLRWEARQRLATVIGLIVLGTLSTGVQRYDWTLVSDDPVSVALVQGAVPQDRKWLPEQLRPTLELYDGLSATVAGVDIVLWPEVAVPALADNAEDWLVAVSDRLASRGSSLALGILTRSAEDGRIRNSLMAPGSPAQYYHKRHLVPFGEYFPVPDFVRQWMRMMNLPYTDIAAGRRHQPVLDLAGIPAAPAICYEDAFGAEVRDFLPEARLLVSISNDAWFGDSIAADQHLEIARMRSLETGRPMLRATNTGVTALIGPRGELLDTLPPFVPGVLTREIRPRGGHTPFTRTGNLPIIIAAIVWLIVAAGTRLRSP